MASADPAPIQFTGSSGFTSTASIWIMAVAASHAAHQATSSAAGPAWLLDTPVVVAGARGSLAFQSSIAA